MLKAACTCLPDIRLPLLLLRGKCCWIARALACSTGHSGMQKLKVGLLSQKSCCDDLKHGEAVFQLFIGRQKLSSVPPAAQLPSRLMLGLHQTWRLMAGFLQNSFQLPSAAMSIHRHHYSGYFIYCCLTDGGPETHKLLSCCTATTNNEEASSNRFWRWSA